MCCLADNIPPFLAEKYVYKQWLKAFTGGCENRPIDSKQVKILVCKRRPGHSSLTRTNQKILEFSFFTSLPWMCINSSSLMVDLLASLSGIKIEKESFQRNCILFSLHTDSRCSNLVSSIVRQILGRQEDGRMTTYTIT